MTEATSVPRNRSCRSCGTSSRTTPSTGCAGCSGSSSGRGWRVPTGRSTSRTWKRPAGARCWSSGLSEVFKRAIRSVVAADFRDVAETAWPNLSYSITVLVPDVDAHYAHAVREGARRAEHARRSTMGSAATTKRSTSKAAAGTSASTCVTFRPPSGAPRRLREARGQSRSMTRPSYAASTPARRRDGRRLRRRCASARGG